MVAGSLMQRCAWGSCLTTLGLLLSLTHACDRDAPNRPEADHVPPDAVHDLVASALSDSSFLLTWTAPGDDGAEGTCARYDIRGSLQASGDSWWDSATVVFPCGAAPRVAHSAESLAVTVPVAGAVWYFALRAADEVPNWSELSNTAVGTPPGPDTIPPGVILDLLERAVGPSWVELVWTAPGDDGTLGTAAAYDLRYSRDSITEENWAGAISVPGLAAPGPPGSLETFTVGGLDPATRYCFAIRASDEVPNVSGLSPARGATTLAVTGRIIAVDPEGTGDYATIQAAIDSSAAGDRIELADGTYRGDGNRDLTFRGKAVTVCSRSGDPAACIIDCEGSFVSSHRGVAFESSEGPLSVLEGVTITNAYNLRGDAPQTAGAAVYCGGSSPTLRRCIVTGNDYECYQHLGCHPGGSAICGNDASPRIEDCDIYDNSDDILFVGESSPTFIDCRLGDPLYLWCPSFVMADCALTHGGLDCNRPTAGVITRCTFNECGGGPPFRRAGAIDCSSGTLTITGCAFEENAGYGYGQVDEYWVYGRGAGVLNAQDSDVTLIDCAMAANRGLGDGGEPPYAAGAILATRSRVTLIGCTLNGNDPVPHEYGVGVGLFSGSTLAMENTILAGTLAGPAVYCDATSLAAARCCDLFGNAGGDWIAGLEGQGGQGGNLSADPLFCDPENRVFTLSARSPCLPERTDCGLIGAFGVGCE